MRLAQPILDVFVMGQTNTSGVMTCFQPVQAVGQMLVGLFEFDAGRVKFFRL